MVSNGDSKIKVNSKSSQNYEQIAKEVFKIIKENKITYPNKSMISFIKGKAYFLNIGENLHLNSNNNNKNNLSLNDIINIKEGLFQHKRKYI